MRWQDFFTWNCVTDNEIHLYVMSTTNLLILFCVWIEVKRVKRSQFDAVWTMLERCVIRKVVVQSFHPCDNTFPNSHNRSEPNIERLQSHAYTNNLFNVYVTQVKSREGKNYSVQSHFTFSSCASLFHHIFLCSMNDNHWVREHSSTYVTITSITSAKKTSFVFESKIESRHRCIEYHQWRAEQRRCIIIKQHRHSHLEFSRASRAE